MTTVRTVGGVSLSDQGEGPVVVLLHGGGGPQTVAGFAELLAKDCRVLTPTHPGFAGTPRPEGLDSVRGLARRYAGLIADLADVTVVGNSVGGWIAAEIGLLGSPAVARTVLVDAVGLDLPATPVVDFFELSFEQVVELSYADPDRFRVPVPVPPEIAAGNRAALAVYGGRSMTDPGLLGRLPGTGVPTLVVWGAADRIVPSEHGRAYADAIPDARLEIIPDAGHLPQLETPDELAALIRPLLGG